MNPRLEDRGARFEVYFCPRFQNLILSRQASKSLFTRALKRHYVLLDVISPTKVDPSMFLQDEYYDLKERITLHMSRP